MLVRDLARLVAVAGVLWACGPLPRRGSRRECRKPKKADAGNSEERWTQLRKKMVERHLVERGIKNKRVLDAFRTVPRHKFLPPGTQRQAYDDESIPIGEGQTITPPYDVAFMTEVLDPKPTDMVYEVGTGSGYQSAILSRLVKEVYSVEIHEPLSEASHQGPQRAGIHEHPHASRRRLRRLARGRAVRLRSSSPARPKRFPSRCSTSSRRGAGW